MVFMGSDGIRYLDFFSELADPRQPGKVRYPLDEILLVSLCAVICGADNWVEVQAFGEAKLNFLRQFSAFEHGVPSHDTFSDVFAALDTEDFQTCFVAWTSALAKAAHGVVAIDGKTLRRSFDRASGQAAIHMIAAWSAEQRLVLGQEKVAASSNEITAIPRLLDLLCLYGAIVTIDAIGCQRAIADKILGRGADYVLALKTNQRTLYEDVEDFFEEQVECRFAHAYADRHVTADADHGRLEERECWATDDVAWLGERHDWPGLRSIAMVRSRRTAAGRTMTQIRYYLTSLPPDAQEIARAVRAHWSIENQLHWVLDVAFGEDSCRVRKNNGPHNLAVLKRLALNLLGRAPGPNSIALKRKAAGWHDAYLQTILTAP